MKPRTRNLSAAVAGLVALALLPTPGLAGQAECFNASSSLASMVNDPTTGDEAFFKLPTGPANVMVLMDTSGSMLNMPQCGDPGWNNGPIYTDTAPTPDRQYMYCTSPKIAAPPTPVAPATATVYGTCKPWEAGDTGVTPNLDLAWMANITPTRAFPDPGHPTNALGLRDDPAWGTGCVGDACMFDPDAYYFVDDWSINNTTHISTARRRASETDATLPRACIALDNSGNPITDLNGNTIDLGPDCRTCMGSAASGTDGPGFFFYRVTYQTGATSYATFPGTTTPQFVMRGTFLNANPPKFVSSRKVVKDLAWMDPAAPSKLDQVRQGLSILCTSCGTRQKATLVVPLGPDKVGSFPPTQAGFVQARQTIIDAVNDKIPGHFHPANTATPLASALFNVGQYFSTPGLYTSLFGSSYEIASFRETAAGTVNAPWVTKAGAQQCSVCWACSQNSIIMVTDGAPNNEITFPAAISGYDTLTYTAAANCGASGAKCFGKDPAPRVASWEHNTDLRTELAMGKQQAISVHTIGFNLLDPLAVQLLKATANMGVGSFQNAKDASQLTNAVFNAINTVVQKQNSFSAASASSLQTVQTASAEAFLTRFKPNETATWEGHLYRGAFFDEFLNGCDPTKPPALQPTVQCAGKTVSASFNGVTDPVTGNAVCTGVYLIDSDCDEVAEDPQTGDFVKKGQAIPANFPWDAGAVLSTPGKVGYRSADETAANARNIFTWLNGAKVAFTTANVATLKPFLNIDPGWCSSFLTLIGIASADPTTECAKQVIHFVRGWDVTDNDLDGCWGPGNGKNTAACPSGLKGEERNRINDSRSSNKVFWKLGDVFHSSPAVVNPPIDEIRCDTGYEKQCVATLHSPQAFASSTPIATYTVAGKNVDAYDAWRIAQGKRKRVALVGANDGMLHAFDAGDADVSLPQDAAGNWQYTLGTGEELWAFIPPDLLPRLRFLIQNHQYMVDGSVMVRDVWRDFSDDLKKQSDEYRTVAIVGERTGGTQYSALDVSDPVNPTFLWSFPDPSVGAAFMGQSWMDFAPRPPPMGPVRIASNRDPRGFEERWIAMINGGYDPAMTLGRIVWMVDVWTGKILWSFSDNDFKSNMGYGSGTSMFPVAAGVALMDIGDPTSPSLDSDGFFDTATWGDLGGNLWVARFHKPGVLDASGRVTNWFAARTFEEQRRTDDLQGVDGRNEFFYMTANAFEPTTRTLRTFLGSASRERLMDGFSTCGSDNLMGCCRAGCSAVGSSTTESYGACSEQTSFTCQNGFYQLPSMSSTCGPGFTCAAAPVNQYSSSVSLSFTCPGAIATAASGHVNVDANGVSSVAGYQPVGAVSVNGTFNPLPKQRFYAIWSYGRDTAKMFQDAASARAFDQNRFTDASYGGACTGPTGGTCTLVNTTPSSTSVDLASGRVTNSCAVGVTKCVADVNDAGWFYQYGDTCPLASCSPPPPWNDEKTGSSANVILGCTSWSGFRPVGSSTSTDPCSGTLGVPVSYGYLSNYVSGTPTPSCGYSSSTGGVYRAGGRVTTAPPSGGMVRVTVSPDGKVAYSTLSFDAGAPPGSKQLSVRSEIGEPVYWLEVSRSLHECRHVAGSSACD
jgi:type IV pilus assembly protein PilY1